MVKIFAAYERVAGPNVVIKITEWPVCAGGVEPEGETCNFYGCGVDVDTVDVAGEDLANLFLLLKELGSPGELLAEDCDAAAFKEQVFQRVNQKGTGAAGRVDYGELMKSFTIAVECGEPLLEGGGAACGDGCDLVIGQADLLPETGEAGAEGFFDDDADNPLRRVIDSVAFAFGDGGERGAAVGFGFQGFEFGDGLLEDAAEGIEGDALAFEVAAEVIRGGEVKECLWITLQVFGIAGLIPFAEDLVGNVEAVEFGIAREEAAVEAVDGLLMEDASAIHGVEELAQRRPNLFSVLRVDFRRAETLQVVAEEAWRETEAATHVFTKEHKDGTVEDSFCETDELAGRSGEVWIVSLKGRDEAFAVAAVLSVKGVFQFALADELASEIADDLGVAGGADETADVEEPEKNEALEGGFRGVRKQRNGGVATPGLDDEALVAAGHLEAAVEPELVHVGDYAPMRLDGLVSVKASFDLMQVGGTLLDGSPGVVLSSLRSVQAGMDVFELAKSLRNGR